MIMWGWILLRYTITTAIGKSKILAFSNFLVLAIAMNYTFFYKNNFIRTRGSFFDQNSRTIPASAEEQSLKFWVKVVNKTAESAASLAKCILLHASARTTVAPVARKQTKTSYCLLNKLE